MSIRTFIEVPLFTKLIEEIGDRVLLKRIQDEILKQPSKGDVIPGSGGVRKVRIGKEGSGKSGGYRVIYLDLPDKHLTYLITVYDKRVSDNITDEQKKLIKALAQRLKGDL
jgi:hypothetical protein